MRLLNKCQRQKRDVFSDCRLQQFFCKYSKKEPIIKAIGTKTPKKEEIKEDPKPAQSTTNTNTEKYVRNDEMINKIRGVMQNNESDFMKQYGYNIVVDSSIKAQTNQFTYTESRVINYLKYKFGTIRIYAEDYYKNGNLIMTMCYIL